MKRALDFTASALGISLLAPIMGGAALWIALDSRGPIFYRGKRVGKGGKDFEMLKFRTMVTDADKIGASSTSADDVRITRAGKVLRRFKLDELPQLINVLFGQMSLVGPRPQVRWAVELYSEEEKQLLNVRPGITDWASIRFRNEGEILAGSADPDADYLRLIAPTKIRLGLHYVRHGNVGEDLKIIVATVLSIFGVDPSWCLPPLPEPDQEERSSSLAKAA